MPPRNSTPSGLEPKSESLEGVLSAIRSLAEVVEKHVSTSGTVKPKDAEIEGCTIEQFRKLGPPSFLGNPDPTEAESWIMQMEKIFDVIGCIEVQKVSFASFMLKGEAEHWWRSTKKTVPLEEDEILTWTVFLDAFYEKYFPESVRDEKEVEFMELIQGNKKCYSMRLNLLSCLDLPLTLWLMMLGGLRNFKGDYDQVSELGWQPYD